jgi:putative ABC transport system permease protein
LSRLSLRFAFEHARSGIGRVGLTIAAVALGVALVVAIQLMNAAVLTSFLDSVDAVSGRASLTISTGDGLTFAEDVVDDVSRIPGVKLAVPLVRSATFPDDGSGELLTVHGVDVTHDAAVRVYHDVNEHDRVVDDPLVFVSQPDSIVLGRDFANRRGLRLGNKLDLVTPQGVKRFTVRGLVDPQGQAKILSGRLVVMDLLAAEQAFTSPSQINQIDVLLHSGVNVREVQKQIQAAIPAGLRVDEPSMRKDLLRKTIASFQAMLSSFGLLAVFAGFVICYSRLCAVFEERTWEIGLLRAVGLSRGAVVTEMLKEALLVGFIGTTIGIPLGIAAGSYWLPSIAEAVALNFGLSVPRILPGQYNRSALAGLFAGCIAAVLAALVPAIRLARTQPVVALAHRGRELPSPSNSRVRHLFLTGLVATSSVLLLMQASQGRSESGLIASAAIALACSLCAPDVVAYGLNALRSISCRLFGTRGELALEHLSQQQRRSSLAVATLGLGIGGVLMFGILAWSFETTLVSQIESQFQADLVVSSPFSSEGWITAPLAESLVDDIQAIPDVAAAAGFQAISTVLNQHSIFLFSYDSSAFSDSGLFRFPLESGSTPNALAHVAQGSGVLISSSLARELGLSVGDTISLESPTGQQKLRIFGITRAEVSPAVLLTRSLYRTAWNDNRIREVHVRKAQRVTLDSISAQIGRRVGQRYRIQTRSGSEFRAFFASQARQAFSGLYLMEFATFALVLVGLGDTLAAGIFERKRHFAMMRAIGLSRPDLAWIVVLESVTIGVLGLAMAIATGMTLGIFWVLLEFPAVAHWDLELHIPYNLVLSALLLVLLVSLTAAALPSIRLASLPVSSALRDE